MCLAIYKPKGIRIARRYLQHGFDNNSDGAGFAICVDNKVVIFKGYTTFASFYDAYERHADKTAIIHFRQATHGDVTEANCHPYNVHGDRYAMIHNGIINIAANHDKAMSDTWHFAELVLAPMLKQFAFDHPALKYLIETSLTAYNKVVMLRNDGAHMIYNEKNGDWHRGAWYSNDSYKHGRMIMHARDYMRDAWERVSDKVAEVTEKFPDYEPSGEYAKVYENEYAQAVKLLDQENEGKELTKEEAELLDRVFSKEYADCNDDEIIENPPVVKLLKL
jgi:predicted glutamine amidotransferase